MSERTTAVAYIMGSGRSGSTILDAIIGRHVDWTSAGELINLTRRSWASGERCSCGQPVSECGFWRAVVDRWGVKPGRGEWDDFVRLQGRFERLRRLMPGDRGFEGADGFDRYLQATEALYEAIASVAGTRGVVDSSKAPARGLAMSRSRSVDVQGLHLVRDPRGVAWSYRKALSRDEARGVQNDLRPQPAWRTAVGWLALNGTITTRASRHAVRRLRYEDLVARPEEVMAGVGRSIGSDFNTVMEALQTDQDPPETHAVAGNRVRMARTISLEADLEWTLRLPMAERLAVGALCGPLMSVYGYFLAGAARP